MLAFLALVPLLFLALAPSASAAPPVASFSYTPTAPLTLETVTFTSTSVGNIASEAWDLNGDGVFDDAAGSKATTSFPKAGTYRVGLRVTGPSGQAEQVQNVTVTNRPPSASITLLPATPVEGTPVSLVSMSTDPDGGIALQQWDLDNDGAFDDASGALVTTTFPGRRPYRPPASRGQRRRRGDRGGARGGVGKGRAVPESVPGGPPGRQDDEDGSPDQPPDRAGAARLTREGALPRPASRLSTKKPGADCRSRSLPSIRAQAARPRDARDLRHPSRNDRKVHAVQDPARQSAEAKRPVYSGRRRAATLPPVRTRRALRLRRRACGSRARSSLRGCAWRDRSASRDART